MKRVEYISDEQVVRRAKAAVKIELDKNKALDIPVTVYDRKTNAIYHLKPNGERVLIQKKNRVGYRERMQRIAEYVE